MAGQIAGNALDTSPVWPSFEKTDSICRERF
jgi:hypothetical protein